MRRKTAVCIDNDNNKLSLTVGKFYNLEIYEYDCCKIFNDKGNANHYTDKYVVTYESYINILIDKIIK